MAYQWKVIFLIFIGICLHQALSVDTTSEVLRSLADHGDRLYDIEKVVKQLQTHVLDLTLKTDSLATERDELMVKVKKLERSNTSCCNCCGTVKITPVPQAPITPIVMMTTAKTTALTAMTTNHLITGPAKATSQGVQTLRPSPKPCVQSGWTRWFNRDTPLDGIEQEHLDANELDQYCHNGHVTTIACATSNGIPAYFSKEIFTCELSTGILCRNIDNDPAPCSDYKIRYYCSCLSVEATTVI